MERTEGLASYVIENSALRGTFRRFRDWEAETGYTDARWEHRLELDEWENIHSLTNTQLELVFWTTFRKLLTVIVEDPYLGLAIREADKLDDDINTRKAVGKIIDGIADLSGTCRIDSEGESAITKVISRMIYGPFWDQIFDI